jgi:hypothetical protein
VGIEALADSDPYRIHYRVDVPPSGAEVWIQQLYFPGWHVEIDGRVVGDAALRRRLAPDGRMRLTLAGGQAREVLAYYAGVPGQARLVLAGCAGLAGLAVYLALPVGAPGRRRRKTPAVVSSSA